jgi:glycerophosphoryl diester phosphodiesterase
MILLDPLARPVIAHRGNRAHAPENTIESFRQAVAAGAEAIEFDVRVSRDGELIVMHDPTLDRTTDAVGLVDMRTLAQLQELDAGARFSTDGGWARPYAGRGIRIPTVNEVVDALPSTMPLLIEIKTPNASEPLRRLIAHRGLEKRVIVAGFNRRAIHPLRGAGLPLGATTSEAVELLLPALRGRQPSRIQYDALCIPPRWRGVPVPIGAMTRALRGSGKVVHIWTINEPADAQNLWRAGVQGIVTDDPALILAARIGV